jgi:predicted ATPase/DNA-binding CsgD family transcriptional regulator
MAPTHTLPSSSDSAAAQAVDSSRPPTVRRFPNNLPLELNRFIGRERELRELKPLLWSTRLLTLTGPGGCGKTRLALHLAADLLDAFADGAWLVELAALSDPALVPQAVASALDLREQAGRPVQQILIDYFGSREVLLVLDNCEHLILACAQLAEALLHTCPNLRIVATCREALNIAGEIAWLVPPLSLPDPKTSNLADALQQSEAVQLFITRAVSAQPTFGMTDQNATTITQICQRLDGLPLAIELAASRVKALSVEQIAAYLDDRFRLFTGGYRTALPRHQTLQAAIDWSYSLLSEAERTLFRRLSVFAGGWTVEAAEATAGFDGMEAADVLKLLSRLIDKSLVQVQEQSGAARHGMLETIKQYAYERLIASDELDWVQARQMDFFLNVAEQANREIHGPQQIEWIDRLEADHDNYRVALSWCMSTQQTEAALRLLGALAWSWQLRGYYSEVRTWFNKVRALPEVTDYPTAYAKMLNNVAYQGWKLGDYRNARSFLEESRAIWLTLGAEGECGLAEALSWLGMVARWDKLDNQTALSFVEQGVALYRKCGDRWGLAVGLFHLGIAARDQHDYAVALSWFEQSLAMFRQLGDLVFISRVSQNMGRLVLQQGDFETARSLIEQALMTDQRLNHKSGIALGLSDLGNVYRYRGEYDRAEELYEKSLAVSREYHLKPNVNDALHFLGLVALHRNQSALAAQYFTDAYDAGCDIDENGNATALLIGLAAVAAETNQPERAAKLFGAGQSFHVASVFEMVPLDRAEFDRHISVAREQLGEAAFEAAQAKGRAMTMEQAVDYALAGTDAVPQVDGPSPTAVSLQTAHAKFGGLTAREREVAVLVAQGQSNRDIATTLVLSERTVASHVSNILSKLEFNSRTQIAAWAIEKGLVNPQPREVRP